MIDKEVAAGISPENIFICGFSQGGGRYLMILLVCLASILFQIDGVFFCRRLDLGKCVALSKNLGGWCSF